MGGSLVILRRKIRLWCKQETKTLIFEPRPQCSPKPVRGVPALTGPWALGPPAALRGARSAVYFHLYYYGSDFYWFRPQAGWVRTPIRQHFAIYNFSVSGPEKSGNRLETPMGEVRGDAAVILFK